MNTLVSALPILIIFGLIIFGAKMQWNRNLSWNTAMGVVIWAIHVILPVVGLATLALLTGKFNVALAIAAWIGVTTGMFYFGKWVAKYIRREPFDIGMRFAMAGLLLSASPIAIFILG